MYNGRLALNAEAREVLEFWRSIGAAGWFMRSDDVDIRVRDRFAGLHAKAVAGQLNGWMDDPHSCLALVIVLDQFSRNMHRNDSRAFSADAQALSVANHALAAGYHLQVERELADFFFMPLMHSESILDQQRCVALMHAHSNANSFNFAVIHRDIIARFGRFPHRNAVLGRPTSPAEQAYLDAGGFKA
jgi:uncharacterized protein (DUF924 family)